MTEGIYGAAKENTAASKREALAALARGGTTERDAYLAAQESQTTDKARVLSEIMDRATRLGAGAAGAEMQAAAQPGFDRRSQALLGARSSAEGALGQITAANSNYFDQVDAAVPIIKARTDEINEANRIKAEQEAADRELDFQIKQLALMTAQENARGAAARASGASGKEMTPGKIIGALGGQTLAGNVIRQAATEQAGDFSERRGANGPGSAPRSLGAIADEVGGRVGLPAGYGSSLVGITGPKPQRPSQVLTDANAQAELAAREARLRLLDTAKRAASKGTYFEFEKAVDVGEADGMQAAIDYVNGLKSDYLKRNGISRTALLDWVRRYGSI